MDIQRDQFERLKEQLSHPYVSILMGPRQVGKSSLMKALEAVCTVAHQKTRFFNLENPADLLALSGTDATVIQTLLSSGDVVFIDEFQYLPNATKLFKAIVDHLHPVKIVASGSSALEMHRHLKESLAGRYRITHIGPLTFNEFQQQPHVSIEDYMRYGGLPGLVHERTPAGKLALLDQILQSYLIKDVKSLIKEENIRAFNQLLYLLADSQGSLISVASLARETGLSEPTIARHLELLAGTYVGFPLLSYAQNLGNELKKSKKYFLYDIGIRNSIVKDFSSPATREDKGVLAESFVFYHLRQQLTANMELRFWRTRQHEEIDFVLIKDRIPLPIEVKYQLKTPVVPPAIRKFLAQYPKASGAVILSKDLHDEISIDGKPVYFLPWDNPRVFEWIMGLMNE